MNKEFIPYDIALKIKELGFNEESLAVWDNQTKELFINDTRELNINEIPIIFTLAPLWQQAWEFFREKYNLNSYIKYQGIYGYYYVINYDEYGNNEENCGFHFEEARLKCLEKLIEIVENENK